MAWRDGDLGRRLPGWLSGTLAVGLIIVGMVVLVEMMFQATHGDDEFAQVLGMEFDAAALWGWLTAAVLVALGVVIKRATNKLREDQA